MTTVVHVTAPAQPLFSPIATRYLPQLTFEITPNALYSFTNIQPSLVRISCYTVFRAMSQYRYSPLSKGSDNIRLLRLMPHKDEAAPIQCELFEYSLSESSDGTHLYEALSYVWGSAKTPKSISIDKHNLAVTVNLHTALSRLRNRTLERHIGTDFVCINQGDEKEKERQIQLIAKIYGQANRVVVCLGEAADDSDKALEDIIM